MGELNRNSPVPLWLQIEEDLRGQIDSGQLSPAGQVPSEIELANKYGVSRMTARKSVDRLVSEGFLFRRAGKGTFVAPPRLAHPASTQTSFSAALAAMGLTVTTKVLHAGLVPASPHLALELSLRAGDLVVHISRLRIVDGQPAAIHTTNLPQRFAGILAYDLTQSLMRAMNKEGASATVTRDTLEAILANRSDARLLEVPEGAPLMRLQSVGFSSVMEPVRFTDSLYRGDRFRFTTDAGQGSPLRMVVTDGQQTA
jgi:GntR family transcriptional regulator